MKLRNKKTGEIVEDYYLDKFLARYEVPAYQSIKEFLNDWEDAPKPIIKDEKIRKAVKAWAEANHLSDFKVYVSDDGEWLQLDGRIECSQDTHSISFTGTLPSIDANKWYLLAELCGEEE